MQGDLFGHQLPVLPEGFRYAANVVPQELQDMLLGEIPKLPFRTFDFHGFEGKRRVVSYGWKYDFDSASLRKADDMPAFLLPLRDCAADFAGLASERLQQVLVSEYDVGAPIGWHRDKAVFGVVVGVSLLASCTSACAARSASNGSECRSPPNRDRPMCCPVRQEPSGSIRFRRSRSCATRSPSGNSAKRNPDCRYSLDGTFVA